MALGRGRDGRALVLSAGLHAALALALALGSQRASPPSRRMSPPTATEIQLWPAPPRPARVRARPAPPESPAPALSPPAAQQPPPRRSSPAPRLAVRPPAPVAPDPPIPRQVSAPPQPTPAAVGSAPGREVGSLRPAAPAQTATAPPPRIDLFPAATLCKTVGCAEGPPADPGQALQARLAAEQAERAGAEDVRAGRVDPLWREVERDAEKSFAPPEKSVTSASRGELALRQLFRPVQPAPETTQAGWLVNSDTGRRIANEVRAAQDAYDEAAVGCEAEIEAEIDAEGEVVAVRILRSSGHRAFDAEALRAVRQALRLRPPSSRQESRGPVLARYALRGEVAVNLPRVGLVTEPNTGASHTPLAQVAGTFDEVTGKGEVRVPFLKRLKKSVRLLSVRRR